jgi:hypothetical protein
MRPEKAFRWIRNHDKHLNMIDKMYDLLSHINFPAGILRFAYLCGFELLDVVNGHDCERVGKFTTRQSGESRNLDF